MRGVAGRGDRPMVVTVYSRLEVGGIEHLLVNLLPRLNSGRYRACLCLLKRPGEMAPKLTEQGVGVHVVPFRGRLNLASIASLARLFRTLGARVVHAHARENITSAAVAARIARVPVVVGTIHNLDTVLGARRVLQEKILDHLRDAVVTVSDSVRRNYCQAVGIDTARVRVIYNGIDVGRFDSLPRDPEAVLAPIGVRAGERVVVCVARLAPQKAQEVLLAAAVRVLPREPKTKFLIVGEGDRLGFLQEEARRLGVGPSIVFTGKRDDVARLMRCSDIFALTSNREGFPLVLIEALAAGLPVVATNVGGNAEAVEEGVSGFIVPAGDPDTIAERLLRLLADEPLRARMSTAARARADRFSLDETARATEALYDGLLRARGIEPPGTDA